MHPLTLSAAKHKIQELEATLASTKAAEITAALEWLTNYHQGWYGPKSQWTRQEREDFEAHAGFLMLYIEQTTP